MTEKPHDQENCKCTDHNHDDHDAEEFDTVVLTDDEGKDHEFLHLDTLELEGSTYFVLMPISEDESADEEDDEAIILKLGKDAEGGEMLLDIEDDEEWEKVADAWETLVESEEDGTE